MHLNCSSRLQTVSVVRTRNRVATVTSRPRAVPPVLPGFEYVRHLGSGGFADVYLFQEQNLGRRNVAVKVLLRAQLVGGAWENFDNEATLMAKLSNHPSIVSVHQAGISADGRPFIVMEYCSKPTLHARYRGARFSEAETLRVGVQIAGAVETAHRAGILHRDIKPANIMMTDYGRPALTDFGIAATTAGGAPAGMSVPWAPPEAFDPGRNGDARSDVYSLAATLYTVLAGRSPFEIPGQSTTTRDLMGRIQTGALPRIDRTDVRESVEEVLAIGMARDPGGRYPSAMAFARALQRVQIELGMQPTTVDVVDDSIDLDERLEDEGRTIVRPVIALQAESPYAALDPATPTTMRSGDGMHAAVTSPESQRHALSIGRRPVVIGVVGVVAAMVAAAGIWAITSQRAAEPPPSSVETTGERTSRPDSPMTNPPSSSVSAPRGFICWSGKRVDDVDSCGNASGIEGLKYVYPSLTEQWSRCKYADLLPTTVAYECRFNDGIIRYRYWKNVSEADKGIAERYASAEESEFILDGKPVGTMYRPTEREKTGLYAMLAHWGMGHYSVTVTAKTRAQQEHLWSTVTFRAISDLHAHPTGRAPRIALQG